MPEELANFRRDARVWLEAHSKAVHWQTEPVIGLIREINTEAEVREVREWNLSKFNGGWAGIVWPERYGGQGRSLAEYLVWREEVARFTTPEDGCVIGPWLVGPIILEHGNDEQKDSHITSILNGDHIWCQLFSEPEAGSDLAGLRTTAVRSDTGWILNGQKIWSSVAQFADWGLLLARTDRSASKHKGITCFMLDMKSPGISVKPINQMNGQQTFNEVWFDDVLIPDSNRIGESGNGWRIAMTTLTTERLDLGLRRGINMSRLIRLAMTAKVDGSRAVDDGSFRDRLIDLYIRTEALAALGRHSVEDTVAGRPIGAQGPITKLIGAELMNAAANLAIDMQGPLGLCTDDDALERGVWQHSFLSSPARRIGGGTDEIQRNIIAERHLGMPRD